MKFIIGLILIAIILIILIDIVPILTRWISRIHIGRYENKEVWRESIANKSIEWLNNTPKIKVTDNERLVFIDMINKNYTKDAIQHWQEAAMILGLETYEGTNKEKANAEIKKFLKIKLNDNGDWKEKSNTVDSAILSYALMKIKDIDLSRYKPALDYTFNLIKEHIGKDGTVRYRKNCEEERYVDTVGFICPFLIRYGIEFNNKEAIEISINQIKSYENLGMLNGKYIPYHGYDINTKNPLGLCGWGRGLGWFSIGLIDSWIELPKDHKYKKQLEEIIINYTKEIIKLQQSNGGWGWISTIKNSTIDSSTTATLGWFLINASKIQEVSKEAKESATKAVKYLMKVTRKSGVIDFSQGDTKAIGVYSQIFDKLPFTQGYALRLINEEIKL